MPTSPSGQAQPGEHALDRIPPGRWATITRMDAGDRGQQHRLIAMGVCVGRQVKLLHAGNPLIIRVMNTRIGLSRELAKGIHVCTCEKK